MFRRYSRVAAGSANVVNNNALMLTFQLMRQGGDPIWPAHCQSAIHCVSAQ